MSNKGFTLIEVLTIFVILTVVSVVVTPIVVGIINDSKKTNRENNVKAYVKEVYNAYIITITENKFYSFNSVENGGITENGIINFTNEWLNDNVNVLGITCNGEDIYSTVFYDVNKNTIVMNECVIDNIKYSYIDEKVVEK